MRLSEYSKSKVLSNEDKNEDKINNATFIPEEDPNESSETHGVKLVPCNIKKASNRIDMV
jgi:hypothetical protein